MARTTDLLHRIKLWLWGAALITGCGFTLPHLTTLQNSVPELNLEGDHHERFFRMVRDNLTISGVKVYENGAELDEERRHSIPCLMVPAPIVKEYVASVDSKAQALEYNILVMISATLMIEGHRPINISNSLTRTVLNKAGHALASANEKQVVVMETLVELADELVMRVGYLGRMSDPDMPVPTPVELLNSDEEHIEAPHTQPMTLIEALQQADAQERAAAQSISLDELNHNHDLFHQQLPPVAPELLNQPPAP